MSEKYHRAFVLIGFSGLHSLLSLPTEYKVIAVYIEPDRQRILVAVESPELPESEPGDCLPELMIMTEEQKFGDTYWHRHKLFKLSD